MKGVVWLGAFALMNSFPGCAPQSLSRLEIQSELDSKIVVTKVTGIGFFPFPDASETTNSVICGALGKAHVSHSAPSRIIVHSSARITYVDSSGVTHNPKVRIVKSESKQADFGDVRIVIQEPDEVVVFAGE
jgi:hypothetical protein